MPRSLSLRCAALMLATALPAALPAQTSVFVPGTTYVTPAFVSAVASGSTMAGMHVDWTFADLTTGQGIWGDIGGGGCGIDNGGFRLILGCDDDARTEDWILNNSSGRTVTSMRMRGRDAGLVFDCGWIGIGCQPTGQGLDDGFGTSGSGLGYTLFAFGGSYAGWSGGEYANLVGVGGANPVGDLFEQLTISFNFAGLEGLGSGLDYRFRVDVDQSGPLTAVPTSVPEPGTWSLIALGLATMAAARRLSRRSCAASPPTALPARA